MGVQGTHHLCLVEGPDDPAVHHSQLAAPPHRASGAAPRQIGGGLGTPCVVVDPLALGDLQPVPVVGIAPHRPVDVSPVEAAVDDANPSRRDTGEGIAIHVEDGETELGAPFFYRGYVRAVEVQNDGEPSAALTREIRQVRHRLCGPGHKRWADDRALATRLDVVVQHQVGTRFGGIGNRLQERDQAVRRRRLFGGRGAGRRQQERRQQERGPAPP